MYRFCLAVLLTALASILRCEVRADDPSALRNALALEQTVQEVIQQAEPSIACILVSRSDAYRTQFKDQPPPDRPGELGGFDPLQTMRIHNPFRRTEEDSVLRKCDLADPENVPEAYGSGVVLDSNRRLILTNYHVIREATKLYVRLPGGKGSYANIHAADARSDLAVLRLIDKTARPVPELKLGDGSSVRKGQFVIALANPFAAGFRDGSPSASAGIISNVRRRAPGTAEEEKLKIPLHLHPILLQTDARLNLGCSGGALLNLRGEMIGLTSARAAINGSETAGGFALPLDANMLRIIDRLREGREVEYGFLGVGPDGGTRQNEGVRIGNLTIGSPAEKAGLSHGETILAVNGQRVNDFEDLVLTVGTLMAGTKAELEVRNHSTRTVSVTLAKFYVPGPVLASNRPAPVRGMRVDYTSILVMMPSPSSHRTIPPGVYVSDLTEGSPAASKLKKGVDIITHVKVRDTAVAVNTPAEFYRAVEKIGVREPLVLTLLNGEEVRID